MNGKKIKKCINSIVLPESSKERIIRELESIAPDKPEQIYCEEYVFEAEPAKKPVLHYTMTAISACAVFAVAAAGVYALGRGGILTTPDVAEQKASVNESMTIAPEELSSLLDEYNQEHGTQLRFPTEEECIQAGTSQSECFEFLSGFPDRASFLSYVQILTDKGETVISSFHCTSLYSLSGDFNEVIGYYYYPYNASGQTYGISGIEGLRYRDVPDLIAVITDEGANGYITKEDFWGDEPSSPEEAVKMMEERETAIKNGTYAPEVVTAYDSDGKTVVGTFTIGSDGETIFGSFSTEAAD